VLLKFTITMNLAVHRLEYQFSGHAGGVILLSVFHMASFHYLSSSF
jgi:hypothetical protein